MRFYLILFIKYNYIIYIKNYFYKKWKVAVYKARFTHRPLIAKVKTKKVMSNKNKINNHNI